MRDDCRSHVHQLRRSRLSKLTHAEIISRCHGPKTHRDGPQCGLQFVSSKTQRVYVKARWCGIRFQRRALVEVLKMMGGIGGLENMPLSVTASSAFLGIESRVSRSPAQSRPVKRRMIPMTTPVGTLNARNHRAWGRESSAMTMIPTAKRSPAPPSTGILCIVIPGCMEDLPNPTIPLS